MWDNLGKHLRAGLVLSIILVIAAAAASFTLSFLALREVAGSPITGWGRSAWVFPVFIDIGLIGCEVTLLTLSMMAGTGLQQLMATFGMFAFGALTIWFNTTRVPPEWRIVTAAPPLAGIILTLMFAMLLKAFAKHTGIAWRQQGAPAAYSMLGAPGAAIQGAVWRPDAAPYAMPGSPFAGYGAGTFPPSGAFGQMPSSGQPGIGQLGHAEMPEEAKRRVVEMYLSGLTAEQLGVATGSSVVVGAAALGVAIDERYARRILDEYRAAQKSRNGGRTSVRRKA